LAALKHTNTASSTPLSREDFAALMAHYTPFVEHADRLAIGVSGGGDSMGLAHMLHQWCVDSGKTLHILTVDHKLRPAAADEARQVKTWVTNWPSTQHFTLEWQHDEKPETRIQESARIARYALMRHHCAAHNINALFIAHNADDQYETFLLRLTSGSGPKGLCAMQAINEGQDGFALIRPLLGHSHDDILAYCRENHVPWIEDPSNQDDHYKRVRLRNSAATLSEEGLSVKRVNTLITRLDRAQQALKHYTETTLQNITIEQSDAGQTLDFAGFKSAPEEIGLRILGHILSRLQGAAMAYPPSSEKLESLYARIIAQDKPFQGATLYRSVFKIKNKARELHITKEI
jgi:tRNA(Ile)-lysidine synthase